MLFAALFLNITPLNETHTELLCVNETNVDLVSWENKFDVYLNTLGGRGLVSVLLLFVALHIPVSLFLCLGALRPLLPDACNNLCSEIRKFYRKIKWTVWMLSSMIFIPWFANIAMCGYLFLFIGPALGVCIFIDECIRQSYNFVEHVANEWAGMVPTRYARHACIAVWVTYLFTVVFNPVECVGTCVCALVYSICTVAICGFTGTVVCLCFNVFSAVGYSLWDYPYATGDVFRAYLMMKTSCGRTIAGRQQRVDDNSKSKCTATLTRWVLQPSIGEFVSAYSMMSMMIYCHQTLNLKYKFCSIFLLQESYQL